LQILRKLHEDGIMDIQRGAGVISDGAGTRGLATVDPMKIAGVDLRIGLVMEKLGRLAEAEVALKKASEVFKSESPGSNASKVEAQNVIERVQRAQGQHPRPRFVGAFARKDRIVFEGNKTFSSESLFSGLSHSPDFVLAMHPAGKF